MWTTSATQVELDLGYESAWAPLTQACADFMAANECTQCGMENDPQGILGRTVHYRCAACGWWYSQRVELES